MSKFLHTSNTKVRQVRELFFFVVKLALYNTTCSRRLLLDFILVFSKTKKLNKSAVFETCWQGSDTHLKYGISEAFGCFKTNKGLKPVTWKLINTPLYFSLTLYENCSFFTLLGQTRPSALLFGFKMMPQIEVFTMQMSKVQNAFYPSAHLPSAS